jgi:hypothetical protein
MSYKAKVIKVMIATPGDVAKERQLIRDTVYEWNYVHSEDKDIVLMPVGWESHASPSMGERPQAVINKQVLKDCDLLIAAFWTRLGSPTGKATSGTVEEIAEHLKAGKPAMLYFSSVPVVLESVDKKQYEALKKFKEECRQRGLIEEYDSPEDFKGKLSRQLAQTVLRHFSKKNGQPSESDLVLPRQPVVPKLSLYARLLLQEGAQDSRGIIRRSRSIHGLSILTNGINLAEDFAARNEAKWETALHELIENELIQERGSRSGIFSVTNEGYEIANLLPAKIAFATP